MITFDADCSLAKRKFKVVTLRVGDKAYQVLEAYAKLKGMSVNAFINSVIDAQVGWFIPLASNPQVTFPKRALGNIFAFMSREKIDELVDIWAIEQKHVVRLIWGELDPHTAFDAISIFAKHLMGTEARIIKIHEDEDIEKAEKKISGIHWVVIRHNLGVNYSYFWDRMFIRFFENFDFDVMIEYDETTIAIRIKTR